MGIPVVVPSYIQGNNQSILSNTTIPDSTLKRKCQSIVYHLVQAGVYRDGWRTAYVNTHKNDADLLTKQLLFGKNHKGFLQRLIHHIYGGTAAAAASLWFWGGNYSLE